VPGFFQKQKSVLEKIDEAALHEWPSDSAWFKVLPEWFISRCRQKCRKKKPKQRWLEERICLPMSKQMPQMIAGRF